MKPNRLKLDLFNIEILFFVGWTDEQFSLYAQNNFGFSREIKSYDGATIFAESDANSVILFWVNDRNNLSKIAHESLHAANMILNYIGHEASLTNDEVQAYLTGYITKHAVKRNKT